MKNLPPYTAVIRTLGKAGTKYQVLLNSLINQTHKPSRIIVYLADGFDIPKETVNEEKIVFVPKGMVAQRALQYKEVDTEWMLFLDDDMSIEPNGVETIFTDTLLAGADVCAIDGFPHHKLSFRTKLGMMLMLGSLPRLRNRSKGYTIDCLGIEKYNPNPIKSYAWSTTNSGNAFLCKKSDFLKINFHEDLWLDEAPYAYPEDRVMFYKMHLAKLKILTHYKSGFTHLDAKSSLNQDKYAKMMYSAGRNEIIFNGLYFEPSLNLPQKIAFNIISAYKFTIQYLSFLFRQTKGDNVLPCWMEGRKDGKNYLKQL